MDASLELCGYKIKASQLNPQPLNQARFSIIVGKSSYHTLIKLRST